MIQTSVATPAGLGTKRTKRSGVDRIGVIENSTVSKMLHRGVAEDERRDSNHANK